MGLVFYNQKAATLIGITDLDFNDVTPATMSIKYRKPSGATGAWEANIYTEGEDPTKDYQQGKIAVSFNDSQYFDELGHWTLWTYLTLADGRSAPGVKFRYLVEQEG